MGLCGLQIPFGWFLTVWISEPVTSVDTVFWPQPARSNLGRPMGQSQVYKYLPGRLYPLLLETTSLPGRNNSDGISGTTLTSLQPEGWVTSKVPTPSPLSTNKKVPEFSHPGPSLLIQALPFGLFSQYTGTPGNR